MILRLTPGGQDLAVLEYRRRVMVARCVHVTGQHVIAGGWVEETARRANRYLPWINALSSSAGQNHSGGEQRDCLARVAGVLLPPSRVHVPVEGLYSSAVMAPFWLPPAASTWPF